MALTLRDPMAGEHHLNVGHRRWSSSHQVAAQENGTGLAGVLMVSSPKMVIRWDNGICHGGIERQCVFHGRVDGGLIQKS